MCMSNLDYIVIALREIMPRASEKDILEGAQRIMPNAPLQDMIRRYGESIWLRKN